MAYKYKLKEEEGHSKYYPGGKTPGLTTSVMNTILKKIADSGDEDKEKDIKESLTAGFPFKKTSGENFEKIEITEPMDDSTKSRIIKNFRAAGWDAKPNNGGGITAIKKAMMENIDSNPRDIVSVDVPLFIRLLEYAREDAKTDMDLHDVAENIITLSASGKVLTMDDYSHIIGASNIEEKQDCWDGYKPGSPKTKISPKTGERVNNCVPTNEDGAGGSMSNAAGGYLGKFAYKLPKKQPKLEEETEAPKPNAKNPGASLGAGPSAGKSGVSNNAYVKQFKYKVVPQTAEGTYVQKGSGMEVKKLF
jgi:hypothetical protein